MAEQDTIEMSSNQSWDIVTVGEGRKRECWIVVYLREGKSVWMTEEGAESLAARILGKMVSNLGWTDMISSSLSVEISTTRYSRDWAYGFRQAQITGVVIAGPLTSK